MPFDIAFGWSKYESPASWCCWSSMPLKGIQGVECGGIVWCNPFFKMRTLYNILQYHRYYVYIYYILYHIIHSCSSESSVVSYHYHIIPKFFSTDASVTGSKRKSSTIISAADWPDPFISLSVFTGMKHAVKNQTILKRYRNTEWKTNSRHVKFRHRSPHRASPASELDLFDPISGPPLHTSHSSDDILCLQ